LTHVIDHWYNCTVKPEELKKWRTANGFTQGELGEALGVALMTVSRWERATRAIPPFLHLALKAIPKKGGYRKGRSKSNTKRKETKRGTKRDL